MESIGNHFSENQIYSGLNAAPLSSALFCMCSNSISLSYHMKVHGNYLINDCEEDSFDHSLWDDSPSDDDLIEEIRMKIGELQKRGVQKHLIRDILDDHLTLSRLVITQDFRIFLPDYNNKEIVMPPLPKAVFILFLKHPEGIVFKQLRDYYPELLSIYKQVSNRVVEMGIRKSIRDLTDPTKNSINEKCARIREAFLKEFDERYACHYYITGERGEAKKIILPRELVEWEE